MSTTVEWSIMLPLRNGCFGPALSHAGLWVVQGLEVVQGLCRTARHGSAEESWLPVCVAKLTSSSAWILRQTVPSCWLPILTRKPSACFEICDTGVVDRAPNPRLEDRQERLSICWVEFTHTCTM